MGSIRSRICEAMSFASLGISSGLLIQALDILIVSILMYRALLVIRGTRALPMLLGLLAVAAVYFIAKEVGFVTLAWLIDSLFNSFILLVVVIFQDDIRRALTKVGSQSFLFKQGKPVSHQVLDEIAVSAHKLSKAKLGSLMVIQREIGLEEFMEESVHLDAQVSPKILLSIFTKESPLHDGAVIIQGGRIKAAGCVLPLSFNPDLDPNLGTRHRAALGITERSDAMVVVTSEETGGITLFIDGTLHRNLDSNSLKDLLQRNSAAGGSSRRDFLRKREVVDGEG
jgi:diadenylate cyclase